MLERRLIAVEGVVQGVGFRPFVHRLATVRQLHGSVRNGAGGVLIDVEGERANLDAFFRSLTADAPGLAAIERIGVEDAPPKAYVDFHILGSERAADSAASRVPPDTATCDACLAELVDPGDRRFGHAFISCTDCGPRFTIVNDGPYDRERTTMAAFTMCGACRTEYEDPASRRFHAEAIACPNCGPTLQSRSTANASAVFGTDAVERAVRAILAGEIVALKALGGYQLACDATNEDAVRRLRLRKHRVAKPFALMVRDAHAATFLCELSMTERGLLESAARPIVLLARRATSEVAPSVAPGQDTLGIMLPSTPLHHLLLAALRRPLVMTSGNQSDAPVVIDDIAANDALGSIADHILSHDRPISARADDSVVRHVHGHTRMVRRARGYVPATIPLAMRTSETILALGAHLKNTVCVAHRGRALVSAHVGDLDSASSREAYRGAIAHASHLAGARPTVVAHDLHPEYASTRMAMEIDVSARIGVQHHHAHVASCVAEHGVRGPVIGVAFDGAGLGTDGAIWGGEFLVVDGADFSRAGHLAYVDLPGGDAAARRPWASAASHCQHAAIANTRPEVVEATEWSVMQQLLTTSRALSPRTSSVGRLFDAVASLLGLCHVARFEGEAAMALEAAADRIPHARYSIPISSDAMWTADPADLIRAVVADHRNGIDIGVIAGAFHASLRELIARGCERVRETTGLNSVVLTGGVFMNAMLLELTATELAVRHFDVLIPRLVPCNDGGLSLGQAYVAVRALEDDPCA
ncbi:MAG: carbamoyltransferase HypF [Gemmatimonadota bacterium]|nr:carbamoyltransferase HypF [Gemmatimonadota bacterium]